MRNGRDQPIRRWALFVAGLVACWYPMTAVHESGHVLHAWLSGGRVERVVLHPLEFSRTDVAPNPHPQFVAWGGAIWGTCFPLIVAQAVRRARRRIARTARFFAGYCFVANGVYLGSAVVMPVGDAEDLIRFGVPGAVVAAMGLCGWVCGLLIWRTIFRYERTHRVATPSAIRPPAD
ncbi:MAG: hypothetical protein ACKVU4_13585 [Phycisphaerales bacterium]